MESTTYPDVTGKFARRPTRACNSVVLPLPEPPILSTKSDKTKNQSARDTHIANISPLSHLSDTSLMIVPGSDPSAPFDLDSHLGSVMLNGKGNDP